MLNKHRLLEVDACRGLAIVLMVAFHLVADLKDFYSAPVEYMSGPWYYTGRATAGLFIFLAGISCTLHTRHLRHGLRVAAAGVLVTAATYIYSPDTFVRFGILQFLACAIWSYPLLRRLPVPWLLLLAAVPLYLGTVTVRMSSDNLLLLPFGITASEFVTMDYYPLFPWYGVFMAGAVFGKRYYADRKPLFPRLRFSPWLVWLGQHSLAVYLAHQPVLLLILYFGHLMLSFF